MPQMRLVPTEDLFIDPDVQLAFALEDRRWRAMAADWKQEKVGFLFTIPVRAGELPGHLKNGHADDHWLFSIVEGRHRFLGGTNRLVRNVVTPITEWRVDVHDEVDYSDVRAKALIKLGYDHDRRNVSALEHFKIRVMALDEVAVDIEAIVTKHDYQITKITGRARLDGSNAIGAVASLERLYNTLGPDGFERALRLNRRYWYKQPSAEASPWLGALGLLVRDGYDQAFSAKAEEKLQSIVPAVATRHCMGLLAKKGLSVGHGGGQSGSFSALSYEIAGYIRRKTGTRQLPINRSSKHASQARQL